MRRIDFFKGLVTVAATSVTILAIGVPCRADIIPSEPAKVVATSDSQSSQPSNPPRPAIGFDIGEYLPTDAVVKNRFGAQWFTIGLGEGQIPADETKGQVRDSSPTFSPTPKATTARFLIPLGIEYELGLGTGAIAPYVGVGGEVIASVVQSATDSVKSQLRGTFGGSVYAGLNLNHNANVEVRYRGMEKIAGYDFNGGEATIGLRF